MGSSNSGSPLLDLIRSLRDELGGVPTRLSIEMTSTGECTVAGPPEVIAQMRKAEATLDEHGNCAMVHALKLLTYDVGQANVLAHLADDHDYLWAAEAVVYLWAAEAVVAMARACAEALDLVVAIDVAAGTQLAALFNDAGLRANTKRAADLHAAVKAKHDLAASLR